MQGYVQVKEEEGRVEFGFASPLPESGRRVEFDVKSVLAWSQRVEPEVGTPIHRRGDNWSESSWGTEETGLYLGGQYVLVSRVAGG